MEDYSYYVFEFESIRMSTNSQQVKFKVIGTHREDVIKFMGQHNFDVALSKELIKQYDMSEIKVYDDDILHPYKFRSNYRQGEFTVMTTESLVRLITSNLSTDLSQTLLFGECVLRQDIELFKVITETIHTLPHIHLLDFSRADIESTKFSDETIQAIININNLEKEYYDRIGASPAEDIDIIMIEDSLEQVYLNSEICPITIEAYVSYFVELIMDAYD